MADKTDSILKSSKEMKEMYEEAKKAMTAYKGEDYEED